MEIKIKTCTRCKTEKPFDDFYKNRAQKDGLSNWCRGCNKGYQNRYNQDNKEKIAKHCKQYYRNNKEHRLECMKEHYQANKEQKLEYQKQYYLGNKEKIVKRRKQYYLDNKEKKVEYNKQHYRDNKAYYYAHNAKRRAAKLEATPNWLTKEDWWYINEMYYLAKKRSERSGFKWHVDHIIPLQGKTVCGLHIPWNLQLLPAEENLSKYNSFTPF